MQYAFLLSLYSSFEDGIIVGVTGIFLRYSPVVCSFILNVRGFIYLQP